ncbi:MAG: hypothetical protein U5K00_22010 [Melioribacteraceae bacterium]|nr:hypothetical protein [Melioribacteraceae bacterium]
MIEVTMSDGENMYKLRNPNSDEKIAYVMGPGKFGTEMKFEPDPFKNSEKQRNKYQFKKLENMNILGKDCELYSMTTGGNVTTFGGWNSLHLYSKVDMSIGITETIAVDLKENVSVDPEFFKSTVRFYGSINIIVECVGEDNYLGLAQCDCEKEVQREDRVVIPLIVEAPRTLEEYLLNPTDHFTLELSGKLYSFEEGGEEFEKTIKVKITVVYVAAIH